MESNQGDIQPTSQEEIPSATQEQMPTSEEYQEGQAGQQENMLASPVQEEAGLGTGVDDAGATAASGEPPEEGQQADQPETQQPGEAAPEETKPPEEAAAAAGEEQAQGKTQHTGILYKPGLYFKSNLKKRHFRLVPDGKLQYSPTDKFKRIKTIQLAKGSKVEAKEAESAKDPHPHRLILTTPDKNVYCLRADSAEERDAWVSDIQGTLNELEGGENEGAAAGGQEAEPEAQPQGSEGEQQPTMGESQESPKTPQSPQREQPQPEIQSSNEGPQAAA